MDSYHSVLAHQDNTPSTESETDLVHLLGADIVDGDDENGAVLVEQALQLVEVGRLGHRLAPHVFLFPEDRIFKGKGQSVVEVEVMKNVNVVVLNFGEIRCGFRLKESRSFDASRDIDSQEQKSC
jgi:hypothetical protein